MLFYVDCKGKPSIARMVRFDEAAKEPSLRADAGPRRRAPLRG